MKIRSNIRWVGRLQRVLARAAMLVIASMPAHADTPPRAVANASSAEAEVAAARIVDAVNALRARNGLAPVAPNAALSRAAEAFAQYMARTGRYGHEADGRRPRERANAQGYEDCAVDENIGWFERSAAMSGADVASGFYDGWAASPPHRRNMLDPDVLDTGVGLARRGASGRWYAVQMFGRPRSAMLASSLTDGGSTPLRYRVGGEAFTLEPRVTHTHRRCRPAHLVLEPGTNAAIDIVPVNGAHYVAVPQATAGWRLETR